MEDWKERVKELENYLKLLKDSGLDRIVRLKEKLDTQSVQVMHNKRIISELQSVRHNITATDKKTSKLKLIYFFKLNKGEIEFDLILIFSKETYE